MTEETAAIHALQAVYHDLHPHRDPKAMRISDDVLSATVLFTRLLANKIDKLPPRWAHDVSPQPNLRSNQFAEYEE